MTKLFLVPLFLHVLLIFFIGVQTLRSRIKSVKRGETKLSDIATNPDAWPRRIRQMAYNFDSQFDLPMLWYSVSGLLVATRMVDMYCVALSWFFLFSRCAHSLVHMGRNDVPTRMRVFVAGFMAVLALWFWFGVKFFVNG